MNMNTQLSLYALHGFLGLPKDWQVISPESLPIHKFYPIDLYTISSPTTGLNAWAQKFNDCAVQQPEKRILLGYSLGGRLALHALLQRPDLWLGAIIVSAHPGLDSPEEKKGRLQTDMQWSDKFADAPWDSLMDSWNALPVFKNSMILQRNEMDYSREYLRDSLAYWSLGRQENLQPFLQQLQLPILWLRGADDTTSSFPSPALVHPLSKVSYLCQAGHRLLWDQPTLAHHEIATFIKHLSKEKTPCYVKRQNGMN